MGRLPFNGRIFWKVAAAVAVLVVLTFFAFSRFAGYERTTTDTVGATISSIIFSYLVHLWLLPGDFEEADPGNGESRSEGD